MGNEVQAVTKKPITQSFKKLARERVERDPNFGAALLREGIDLMLTGDVDTGKAILRDYIKATVGFERLSAKRARNPKVSFVCSVLAAIHKPVICSA